MADTTRTDLAPLNQDAFLADRTAFWKWFTNATTVAVIAVVLLLIVLALWLV